MLSRLTPFALLLLAAVAYHLIGEVVFSHLPFASPPLWLVNANEGRLPAFLGWFAALNVVGVVLAGIVPALILAIVAPLTSSRGAVLAAAPQAIWVLGGLLEYRPPTILSTASFLETTLLFFATLLSIAFGLQIFRRLGIRSDRDAVTTAVTD